MARPAPRALFSTSSVCLMIRLPILKDELAFLEKLLPELQTRPDLGHLAMEIERRIDRIRQEIRTIAEKADQAK